MKTVLIIALICLVAGALLLGAGWVLLQKNLMQNNAVENSIYSYRTSDSPTQINITTLDSRVKILPIEGDEWRVECKDTETLYHTVELVDGVLTIKQNGTVRKWYEYISVLNIFQDLSPKLTVYLPTGMYESLDICSTSGSIKVSEGLTFFNASLKNASGSITCAAHIAGSLDVKNTSGSITITGGVDGELSVTNGSSSVEIKNATPTSATIKNASGSIQLTNVVCQGSVDIDNTSGSVKLEACDAASFDLRTVSGGIHANILSGKTFDCHSTSGGVHVPENGGEGIFRARTTSGGIRVEIVTPAQ